MRRIVVVFAAAVLCLSFATQSQAGVVITFSTGYDNETCVGRDPIAFPNSPYDIVTLDAYSGSLALDVGIPQIAEVNPLQFAAGYNRYDTVTGDPFPSDVTRTMTVNGVAGSISQAGTIDVSSADTIHLGTGPASFFDLPGYLLSVTPLSLTVGPNDGSAVLDGAVKASFLLTAVPEPISMIFFGTGLVAVGGYMARRKMLRNA